MTADNTTIKTAAVRFTWGSQGFCRFIVDSGEFGITYGEASALATATEDADEFYALWSEGGPWENAGDIDEPTDPRAREALGLQPLHHDDSPSLDDTAPLEHFTERGT